jgi:hypothetical protein
MSFDKIFSIIGGSEVLTVMSTKMAVTWVVTVLSERNLQTFQRYLVPLPSDSRRYSVMQHLPTITCETRISLNATKHIGLISYL